MNNITSKTLLSEVAKNCSAKQNSDRISTLREREIKITDEAKQLDITKIEKLKQKLQEREKDEIERIESYLILFTYYRRMKSISDCKKMYNQYKHEFDFSGNPDDEFLFLHFYSIAIKYTDKQSDLKRSISISRKTLSMNNEYVGALHNLAESLCILSENFTKNESKRNKQLHEALELVNEVIDEEPEYAKFYATRARIYCQKRQYHLALQDISKAIDKECPPTNQTISNDYSLRILDYLSIKMNINTQKSIDHVLQRTKKDMQSIYDDMRKSNLEILSFFVAVIAFVIGSINLAKGATISEAIQLILVLSSSLLVVVSGFSLTFDGKNKFKRFFLSFFIGAIIFLVAIFSPTLF